MSEHTKPNHDQNNDRLRRNRKQRTTKGYADSLIGPTDSPGSRDFTIVKFFVTVAEDETPEIYWLPMNREPAERYDGTVGMKPIYAGDIERNAIPLSMTDLESLYHAMVSMKARMIRMQNEYHERNRTEDMLPNRAQQPPTPLVHRIAIPKAVARRVPVIQPAPTPVASSSLDSLLTSLADQLKL